MSSLRCLPSLCPTNDRFSALLVGMQCTSTHRSFVSYSTSTVSCMMACSWLSIALVSSIIDITATLASKVVVMTGVFCVGMFCVCMFMAAAVVLVLVPGRGSSGGGGGMDTRATPVHRHSRLLLLSDLFHSIIDTWRGASVFLLPGSSTAAPSHCGKLGDCTSPWWPPWAKYISVLSLHG